MLATTPRPTAAKPRLSWQTSWQAEPADSGVTLLSRYVEQLATDGTTAERSIAFTGQSLPIFDGGDARLLSYDGTTRFDVGTLVFEPQPAGQHRVLLRMPNNTTYEALPTRTSAGATARRGAARRTLNSGGTTGRVELVQFFKAVQPRQRTTYYAVYGEDGLVGADGTKQTLTHLINLNTRRIVSLPYKFISIWNGDDMNSGFVLVEPLKADGKPQVGTVLGIPIDRLKESFGGAVADPSTWAVLNGTI